MILDLVMLIFCVLALYLYHITSIKITDCYNLMVPQYCNSTGKKGYMDIICYSTQDVSVAYKTHTFIIISGVTGPDITGLESQVLRKLSQGDQGWSGLQSKFKTKQLNRTPSQIKHKDMAGDNVQWLSTCLTCLRPWSNLSRVDIQEQQRLDWSS